MTILTLTLTLLAGTLGLGALVLAWGGSLTPAERSSSPQRHGPQQTRPSYTSKDLASSGTHDKSR